MHIFFKDHERAQKGGRRDLMRDYVYKTCQIGPWLMITPGSNVSILYPYRLVIHTQRDVRRSTKSRDLTMSKTVSLRQNKLAFFEGSLDLDRLAL